MSETRQPRNILEQIAMGLQTVNDNIVDLFKMVEEIHACVYTTDIPPTSSGNE